MSNCSWWNLGYTARLNHILREHNPYKKFKIARKDWDSGWNAANEFYKKNS